MCVCDGVRRCVSAFEYLSRVSTNLRGPEGVINAIRRKTIPGVGVIVMRT